jgi:hypothetical protein
LMRAGMAWRLAKSSVVACRDRMAST